jgi:Methane oxygenase PmoA
MNCIKTLLATALVLVLAQPTLAQPKTIATFEIDKVDLPDTPICIPLSLPEEFAKLTDVSIQATHDRGVFVGPAQLTQPGLLTEMLEPSAKGLVRRDLHLVYPSKQGKLSVIVSNVPFLTENKWTFSWQTKAGEHAELAWAGKPVMRYMHKAYDKSTPEARDKTYKVFHHLYDPEGKRFVTNGGNTNDPLPKDLKKDLLYPHHRGLMYAFNKITYAGNKPCDTWHAKPGDTHEQHAGLLVTEAGSVLGRHRVAVDWHGEKNDIFAKEEREVTVYKIGKGTLVEFVSRLKTVGPAVKLDGDPQHAGFQFRAHNDIHETKTADQTYYLRPDGKGGFGKKAERNWEPKTGKGPVDLGWDAVSFLLDGKRFTLAYMDHPKNPHPSRWSERDYARIGCYFEYDLTEKTPLLVDYRVWLQEGEMTVDQAAALSNAFVAPPKVMLK